MAIDLTRAVEECRKCKYYQPERSNPELPGECRRHAPVPAESGDAQFPIIWPQECCGDFVRMAPRQAVAANTFEVSLNGFRCPTCKVYLAVTPFGEWRNETSKMVKVNCNTCGVNFVVESHL